MNVNAPLEQIRHAELIAVSDVHLLTPDDLRGRRFLRLMEAGAFSQIGTLVLVGDIFEFMLGSNAYFRKKFEAIGRSLEALAASGTRVVYLEGNHEFDIQSLSWKGVEIITSRDFAIRLKSGDLVKFTHGDLIYSPIAYRRFRAVVKSRWFLFLCSLLPGIVMDTLALKGAKVSRSQDAYRDLDTQKIFTEMSRWLGDAAYGVFGHFHVPFADKVADSGGHLLSSTCWQTPSALVCIDGHWKRLVYADDGESPTALEELVPVLTR